MVFKPMGYSRDRISLCFFFKVLEVQRVVDTRVASIPQDLWVAWISQGPKVAGIPQDLLVTLSTDSVPPSES
jgi:hypothetical protein